MGTRAAQARNEVQSPDDCLNRGRRLPFRIEERQGHDYSRGFHALRFDCQLHLQFGADFRVLGVDARERD